MQTKLFTKTSPLPLLLMAAWFSSCAEGDREVVLERRGPTDMGIPDSIQGPVSSQERFTMGAPKTQDPGGGGQHQGSAHLPFDAPASWVRRPGTDIRILNFAIQDRDDAYCFLTAMESGASNLLDQANRWRRQFGLDPIDQETLDTYPTQSLFGAPAIRVECEGDFNDGLGGQPIQDAALVGLMAFQKGTSVFVKMVGPKEVIDGEHENFDLFVTSIQVTSEGAEAQGTKPHLHHQAPNAWTLQAPRQMRDLGFDVGQGGDLSLNLLPGEGGGVALNMNRWRKQLGLDPIAEEAILAGETIEVMGQKGYWVDLKGPYTGMGTEVQFEDGRMLGAIVPLGEWTLFAKLVGPEGVVAPEESRLRDFLASLTMDSEEH